MSTVYLSRQGESELRLCEVEGAGDAGGRRQRALVLGKRGMEAGWYSTLQCSLISLTKFVVFI